MNTTDKKLTDAETIETLIKSLKTNKKKFSRDLKYNSPMSIYFVTKGKNRITEDMKNRILLHFPIVREEFLTNRIGKPLKLLSTDEKLDAIEQKIDEILRKLNTPS